MLLVKANHLGDEGSERLCGRIERDLSNELSGLAFDLECQLLMDLETLEEDRLQTLSEKSHSEFQILIECLFNEEVTFRQVSMEHKSEVFRVNRDLVDDFILLIVQEVFQKLLLFDLMILLAH